MIVLWVATAGGVGAVCRFLLDLAVPRPGAVRFPLGTVVVNLTGSLLLGLLAGAAAAGLLPPAGLSVAGTGFLGGYTTFSTASFETVALLRQQQPALAVLQGLGTLVGGVLAAATGWLLGANL